VPEDPSAEDLSLPEAEKPSAPRHASAQKRIDELTRQYREEQRRADRLEGEMQAIRRQWDGPPSPSPDSTPAPAPVPAGKPTADSFGTYDEYVEALAGWRADQRFAERMTEERAAQQAREQQAHLEQTTRTFADREAKTKAEIPDYDDVIAGASALAVTPPMVSAIYESEDGPKLRYYLATHPDECRQIAAMPATSALRALGRIEATFATVPSKPTMPTLTAAPAPIRPVSTSSSANLSTDLSDDLSDAEWIKRREAQVRARIAARR
jgi:hypothetical protein